jgi:fatty acid-binding protein DegV
MMQRKVQDLPVRVAIAHADALAAGEALQYLIQSSFNCTEIWLTDFSPVMAYATGAGVLAIGYHID